MKLSEYKPETEFGGICIETNKFITGYYYSECGNDYIIENRQKESLLARNLIKQIKFGTVVPYANCKDICEEKLYLFDVVEIGGFKFILVFKNSNFFYFNLEKTIIDLNYISILTMNIKIKESDLFINIKRIGSIYELPEIQKQFNIEV